MTALAEPARADIAAWLTEAARVEHLHYELLRRQQAGQALAATYVIEQTARQIRDTHVVELWLAQQLDQLPGGER